MNIVDVLEYIKTNPDSGFFYTPDKFGKSNSFFFKSPFKIITINSKEDLEKSFDDVQKCIDSGMIGFSQIAYEFGYLLEEKLENLLEKKYDFDLAKFVFFQPENVKKIKIEELNFNSAKDRLRNPDYKIKNFGLNVDKNRYVEDINKVRKYISIGDTYQVNYTTRGKFLFEGDPADLFLNLLFNQSAEFSAFINNGNEFIISASPELFFDKNKLAIKTRPMKGTIKRGRNESEDLEKISEIKASKKDQAENVMIVDLLRNDLGRVSKFNSVYVESLFDIEKYESLFQMTSTVCAELKNNNLQEILGEIFPCGSITGAPKIRTMEIIKELEKVPRGIYTGSLGIINKDETIFNVAIRTPRISMDGEGEIGIGSGVVWDSEPELEYEETLLKGSFLTNQQNYFEIFETMLFENGDYFLLQSHLDRLKKTADYFLFSYDEDNLLSELSRIKNTLDKSKKYKLKVILDKWGNIEIKSDEIFSEFKNFKVFLSDEKITPDKFIFHKTTERKIYEKQLKKSKENGFDEVLFLNEDGLLTEGSFTNIFLEKNGEFITPNIDAGVLNGCFRNHLINESKCIKKNLTIDDIQNADKVFLGNSVRKLINVTEVWTATGLLVKF